MLEDKSSVAPLACDEIELTIEGQTLSGMTFSGGVADSTLVPGLAEPLLQAADSALLQAKRSGRARVLALAAAVVRSA